MAYLSEHYKFQKSHSDKRLVNGSERGYNRKVMELEAEVSRLKEVVKSQEHDTLAHSAVIDVHTASKSSGLGSLEFHKVSTVFHEQINRLQT